MKREKEMKTRFLRAKGVAIGTLGVFVIAVLILTQTSFLGTALAQTKAADDAPQATVSTALPRTITVVGTGTVTIEPDVANVTLGVETSGTSVKLATNESTETMEAIIAALKAEGVATMDIETSGFSVWSDQRTFEGTFSAEAATTYRVNNNLGVTVRDLDSLGAVLDAAIEAGANSIHGVTFTLAEPEAQEAEARAAAVANARAKAQELAKLTGVEVRAGCQRE